MLLDCQNISKSFGTDELFRNVSFHIEEHEKTALIGVNGCGKTTLLKIITGELAPDAGQVILSSGAKLSYLAQNQDIFGDRTLFDYVMEAKKDVLEMENALREAEEGMKGLSGAELEKQMQRYSSLTHRFEQENGYAVRSEVTGILKGLGFSEADFGRSISTLSGGQKTRVALGRALLLKPELLILDEPTNHLDMASTAWLETYLMNIPGAVLVVSHDRYFLDKFVTRVVEIENRTAMTFRGNYTAFSEKKAMIRKAQRSAWFNQQQEIRHQEEVIAKLKSFNREKSIKRAESREKMLEKIERLEKPMEENVSMRLTLTPDVESGNDVLTVSDLTKSFPGLTLFEDLNFEIHRGERVALIGSNGTGKTTMLKIINGDLDSERGQITLGSQVHIGYYDQEHQVLDRNKTIFEEISDAYPRLTETRIRNLCAAFLFTGDDVFTRIEALSGGERGRISLAKLMLSEANFLLLDEPTNHLDIYSREILEEALRSYTGTVLFVSHDRYFINRVATRILELNVKTLVPYNGNYDEYLEKREALTSLYLGETSQNEETASERTPTASALSWKAQKEELAAKRKRENDLRRLEEAIADLEASIADTGAAINLPENAGDHEKLLVLTQDLERQEAELEALYEKWGALAE